MEPIQIPIEYPIANAALSSVVYEQYWLGHGEVHNEEGISLFDFVNSTTMVIRSHSPFQMEMDGFRTFPGESDPTVEIFVASEEGKKVARTMLKAIWKNEKQGVCFGQFSWDNVIVTRSGKAKVRGVEIIRNLQGAELDQQIQLNYDWARDIIARMYEHYVPGDIQHLLHLMQLENRFDLRPLFHIHASLIPIANFSTLFKEVYDYMLNVLPKQDLCDILDEMRTGNVLDDMDRE